MKRQIIKGENGTMIFTEESVTIQRRGFTAWLHQGSKGDRTYFYKSLSGIEYKPATFSKRGYFKLIASGTESKNQKVSILGTDRFKDENTVIISSFDRKNPTWGKLHNYVIKRIAELKNPTTNSTSAPSSPLDELKKLKELFDLGALNEEEFNTQKKILLDKMNE